MILSLPCKMPCRSVIHSNFFGLSSPRGGFLVGNLNDLHG
jgi:hypothetical protein